MIKKVLHYARRFAFTKYTSAQEEAWRLSMRGLSEPLLQALKTNSTARELDPDADFSKDLMFLRVEESGLQSIIWLTMQCLGALFSQGERMPETDRTQIG